MSVCLPQTTFFSQELSVYYITASFNISIQNCKSANETYEPWKYVNVNHLHDRLHTGVYVMVDYCDVCLVSYVVEVVAVFKYVYCSCYDYMSVQTYSNYYTKQLFSFFMSWGCFVLNIIKFCIFGSKPQTGMWYFLLFSFILLQVNTIVVLILCTIYYS